MMLFIIGVIEMVIISAWTKVVTESKVLASGLITIFNVLIWYYVLNKIVNDISNWQLIIFYALGCAIGTMITTAFFGWQQKKKKKLKSPSRVPNVLEGESA